MPVVLYFSLNENGGAGDSAGWFAFAVIGGGIATLGAIILGLGTKEEDSALRENKTETSFKDVFSVLIKNDQLLWIAIAYLIYGLGVNYTHKRPLCGHCAPPLPETSQSVCAFWA